MNSSKQDHEKLAILAGTPPQDWKVTAVDHAYTYLREVLVKGERDVRSIWQHISLAASILTTCAGPEETCRWSLPASLRRHSKDYLTYVPDSPSKNSMRMNGYFQKSSRTYLQYI